MIETIDNVFPADLIRAAAEEWPQPDWPHWLRYESPLERKSTCRDWAKMPKPCKMLLSYMLCLVPKLQTHAFADATLHGAGMHSMGRGDHLDWHLDADRHPVLGLERRANAILFLEPWDPEWGGEFQMRDAYGYCSLVRPKAGRLVMFETTDHSYHGVPTPVACPEGVQRKSLAIYWWGMPQGESKRPRAQFVAAPGEAPDEAKEILRRERMKLT